MISFYNNTLDFLDDKEVRPFNTTQHTWDTIRRSQMLRLTGGGNPVISGDTDGLTFTANFTVTADSRYEAYFATKQLAMMLGNTAAGVKDVAYSFTGYDKLLYRGGGTQPYLQSIQNTLPTSTGALQVLSSPCVGIETDLNASTITATIDGVLCDACERYLELNAFGWRLYHAVNELAHRLYDFNPSSAYWGTWPSYQALVTVWNNTVWKKNYRTKVGSMREALTLEVGYNCTQCELPGMVLRVRIDVVSGFIPSGATHSSINELLLYQMGTSQVASDSVKEATTVVITKYKGSTGTIESGVGNERVADTDTPWTSYEAVITIPSMKQQDSIVVQFALSRAMYSKSSRNIPRADQYPSGILPTHTLNVTTTWTPVGGEAMSKTESGVKILALDNLPSDYTEEE